MTSTETHPIATAAAASPLVTAAAVAGKGHRRNGSSFRVKQYETKKSTFTHSPMVMAMLTNNRLSNCHDVGKMLQECKKTGSDDQVCQTATKYMQSCLAAE
ncbi:hypothetical protein IV203_019366 [Nitzschia inconspicua]|uniref:CHCH domain-containing protein n=1 Tax=Nitzschia inconspicua TaxID=303405 RepID=A0A9K3Q4V2_9STRA|nr:hypothetical protein IV203_019366 [Nitzschia inconspicua]